MSNLLAPNDKKELFTITIKVFENCSNLDVSSKDHKTTYQEIIGALEVHKTTLIIEQSGYNIKKLSKKE